MLIWDFGNRAAANKTPRNTAVRGIITTTNNLYIHKQQLHGDFFQTKIVYEHEANLCSKI